MAKANNGSSTKPEQAINETLAVEVPAETVPQPETPVSRETLHQAYVAAKLALRAAEDANNMDADHPEVKKAELAQFNAKKALKDFDAEIAKENLKAEMEQKTIDARGTLKSVFGIDDETLNNLLNGGEANSAEAKAKENLKWSFNFLFGKPETNVKSNATSKDLTKSSEKPTNGQSVNDIVKELMDAGMSYEQLLAAGHSDGRIRNVVNKIGYVKNKLTGGYMPKP